MPEAITVFMMKIINYQEFSNIKQEHPKILNSANPNAKRIIQHQAE